MNEVTIGLDYPAQRDAVYAAIRKAAEMEKYAVKISFSAGDEYLVEYPKSSSVPPETIQDACQSLLDCEGFEDFSTIDFIDTVMNSFGFEWRYIDTYNIVI